MGVGYPNIDLSLVEQGPSDVNGCPLRELLRRGRPLLQPLQTAAAAPPTAPAARLPRTIPVNLDGLWTACVWGDCQTA
jgi:hypothetical protein